MTPEVLEALEASARRYREVAVMSDDDLLLQSFSMDECALCALFLVPTRVCFGCPVCEAGHGACVATPWHQTQSIDKKNCVGSVRIAHRSNLLCLAEDLRCGHYTSYGKPEVIAVLRERCVAEAEFLESLLPNAPETP